MRTTKRIAAALLSATLAGGCTDAVGVMADSAARAGVLQLVGYGALPLSGYTESVVWRVDVESNVLSPRDALLVPDTVEAGVPFEVIATTIGLDGCWRAGRQGVEVGTGVVTLTPVDEHSGARVCTQILFDLTHASMVTVPSPGEWTVRVSGRRVRNGDDTWGEPVTTEAKVVAQ